MMADSIIVKLIRIGAGISPDYSLKISGEGHIIYEGKENVKIKGIKKGTIDKDKIVILLSEFKKIGFFSLNDIYPIEKSEGRTSSVISIRITDENGETKTKTITHYHGDKNVPIKLLNLEDKIDKITDSKKWVGKHSEILPGKQSSNIKVESIVSKHERSSGMRGTSLRKTIASVFCIFIVICLLFYTIQSGFINTLIQGLDNDQGDEIDPIAVIFANNVEGVAPFTVDFKGVGKKFDGNITLYEWDIGDGAIYQNQSISYTFTKVGRYNVTLTISADSGVKATDKIQIIIREPFYVSISADESNGLAPLNISFTSDVSGGIQPYVYKWSFGDGNISSDTNPNHTFINEDYYRVKLTVTDSIHSICYDYIYILCR